MEYNAKNKFTGVVTGPFSEEYKKAIEADPATWKRNIWIPLFSAVSKPAERPQAVKPAKTIQADVTSDTGE